MARRAAYTKVEKSNRVVSKFAKGNGDVLFRGFHCLNPDCDEFIFVRDEAIGEDFKIVCPTCKFEHRAGETSVFFDYELRDKQTKKSIETGLFEVLHDDYIGEAKGFKYCVLCSTLKPLELFDRHSARKTERQSECNLCKQLYNSIKNQTRLADQHREASQKRRLYTDLTETRRIDIAAIYKKYDNKCFKCGVDLSRDRAGGKADLAGNLDHTLPVKLLWPLTTDNATLLCKEHNGEKAEKWPSEYYSDAELRKLAPLVGIDYRILKGKPVYNPSAIEKLKNPSSVEALFIKYAAYSDELIGLRNRILKATGFDFFKTWNKISKDWVSKANDRY